MSTAAFIEQNIHIPWAYEFPGVTFRNFNGPTDFPGMVDIIQRCTKADQIKRVITLEDMETFFKHLTNCDPLQDLLLVEKEDLLIGYIRMEWQEHSDGQRIYRWIMNIAPVARTEPVSL